MEVLTKHHKHYQNWCQWCSNGFELESSEFERQEHFPSLFPFLSLFFSYLYIFFRKSWKCLWKVKDLSFSDLLSNKYIENITIQISQSCLCWYCKERERERKKERREGWMEGKKEGVKLHNVTRLHNALKNKLTK